MAVTCTGLCPNSTGTLVPISLSFIVIYSRAIPQVHAFFTTTSVRSLHVNIIPTSHHRPHWPEIGHHIDAKKLFLLIELFAPESFIRPSSAEPQME